jgi:phage gp36-like protein
MAGYFDVSYLGMMGSIPASVLAEFEAANPGRVAAMIVAISRLMDSYLFKRYATPFVAPVPEAVKFHGTQILSHQLRVIIGFDPGSAQDEQIVDARKAAFAWLEQAANSRDGLVELPLREPDPGKADAAGVSRHKARAFSYRSAIDWHREQKGR